MKLSEHFDEIEFGEIPIECLPVFGYLCQNILEAIRTHIGGPITITSGYRSPEANKAAHGVSNSEHIASATHCAADFTFDTTFGKMISVRATFDWIRTNPTLPFHQVILETNAQGGSIIHISCDRTKIGQRQALSGSTHNASPYTKWEVVDFKLPDETEQENA